MIQPTEVEARDGYRIWLRYQDGTAGEVDLSHLAGKGVFKVLGRAGIFREGAYNSPQNHSLGR